MIDAPSASCSRRSFLRASATVAASLALGLEARATSSPSTIPEYAGSLDDVMFVYDQCAAPHLIRQVVEILRLLPADARVNVLVSRARAAAARASMTDYGVAGLRWIVTDQPGVSGLWARDVLQIARGADGGRIAHVPWFKGATAREELDRTRRTLAGLADDDLSVRLLPIAGEGGNLIADASTLYAGSTIAAETRAVTRHFWGFDPGDDGVARVLEEAFGVDTVHWIGPRRDGACARQSRYVFHVDMLMTLVGPDEAVVARCDPSRLDRTEHAERLAAEAARTLEALERREAAGIAWPEDLDLPRDLGARRAFLAARLEDERDALRHAAREMDAAADRLEGLGVRAHRIDADPRRVRRYQSATNVVCARDRLLVPLYPTQDRVHGWVLRRDGDRDAVDVDLGTRDSDFELIDDNRERVDFYRRLHPEVRAVRDYFHLASGNVHCVLGRLT